jgi:PD-(D/E)XK nuclease superfamily
MTAPTIIRASSLTQYPDCPRRTAARLFRREIEDAGFTLRRPPRGIGAAIGSAVHAAAKTVLDARARSGDLAPVGVATDCAAETLAEALQTGEVAFDATTANRSEAMRQAIRMTSAYHRCVAPAVEPIIVEERLEAEISPGLILSGQPDLVAREPGGLRDLKTGARRGGGHAPQVGAYSLLSRTHGLEIETASIDFVQRAPTTKVQPDPVSTAVAVAQAETAAVNIIRHIEDDLATFREGDDRGRILAGDPWSFPANPASNLCSPKFCSAFGTEFCREGDPEKESH